MIGLYNGFVGSLTEKRISPSAAIACLDVQGVEYIFEISRTCLQELPETGSPVRLLCCLQVRDDQMYLCGFLREAERQLFLDLLKVEGIAARGALKILSGMALSGIVGLLENGDVDGLEQIPGLGKKTAQKMVLALKGKLTLDPHGPAPTRSREPGLGEYEDLAQALTNMGYERRQVNTVLERLIPEYGHLPMAQREQELLRRAIMELG